MDYWVIDDLGRQRECERNRGRRRERKRSQTRRIERRNNEEQKTGGKKAINQRVEKMLRHI